MPERSFIRDGKLYEEGGDIYTASHLYTPQYYENQNPILFVPRKKGQSTQTVDIARRSRRMQQSRVTLWRRFIAWIQRVTTRYDILGDEEETHDRQ